MAEKTVARQKRIETMVDNVEAAYMGATGAAARRVDVAMDDLSTPRTGGPSQMRVQLQIAGTGPFVTVTLELSGRASDLLVFSANGARFSANGESRTAKVASVGVSKPKGTRKGHELALRVDLTEPDTAGANKYIVAVESEAELTQLQHLLNGHAQAACLFSPPENVERRRMLRQVVERKINADGRGDWPLPIGTKIAVAGLGVGTYTACTANRVFANEHTIDFGGEIKTLKLKDVHWSVFEDEMHLFTSSSVPRTQWAWQSGDDFVTSWNHYAPEICDMLDAAVAAGEKTVDLMDGQRHVDLTAFPEVYQRVTADPVRKRRVRRVVEAAMPESAAAPSVGEEEEEEIIAFTLADDADALAAELAKPEPEPEPEPEPDMQLELHPERVMPVATSPHTTEAAAVAEPSPLNVKPVAEQSPRQPLATMTNQSAQPPLSKKPTQHIAYEDVAPVSPRLSEQDATALHCTSNPLSDDGADATGRMGAGSVDAKPDAADTQVTVKTKAPRRKYYVYYLALALVLLAGAALALQWKDSAASGINPGISSNGSAGGGHPPPASARLDIYRHNASDPRASEAAHEIQCGDNGRYDERQSSCVCASGFSGESCEINVDDCAAVPCENQGECTDGVDSFKCSCADGFTGSTCEVNTDECASRPCENGGVCADGVAAYSCACARGFSGSDCATDIDECASRPCQNDGICADGVGSYSCECSIGFDGQTCEINIGDCTVDACGREGTCVDGINSFTCDCAEHYYGSLCDVRCEADATCSGHGRCSAAGVCVCEPERSGESCEACSAGFSLAANGACVQCPAGHFQGSNAFSGASCDVCPPGYHDIPDRSTCLLTSLAPAATAGTAADAAEDDEDGSEEDDASRLSVWSVIGWQALVVCGCAGVGFGLSDQKSDDNSGGNDDDDDGLSEEAASKIMTCSGAVAFFYLAWYGEWPLLFLTPVLGLCAGLLGIAAQMEHHQQTTVTGAISRALDLDVAAREQTRMLRNCSLCGIATIMLLSVLVHLYAAPAPSEPHDVATTAAANDHDDDSDATSYWDYLWLSLLVELLLGVLALCVLAYAVQQMAKLCEGCLKLICG